MWLLSDPMKKKILISSLITAFLIAVAVLAWFNKDRFMTGIQRNRCIPIP